MVAVSRSRPGDRQREPADPAVTALMTSRVVAVVPGITLADTLRVMDSAGVRHLPVVENGRCVGLLAEVDVLRRLIAQGLLRAGPTAPLTAGVACRRPAPAVTARGTRAGAARAMLTCGSDAVLVLDDGLVLGIVTVSDLAASLAAPLAADPGGEQGRGGEKGSGT